MKIPYQLRHCEPHPATALLLPDDVEVIFRTCARSSMVNLPVVHAVAGGFLVRLPSATDEPFPGAIRLRSLSANLFVPVDAELTPALLEDEARAMVLKRGLVFLPGEQVLAFAPEVTLAAGDLLRLPRLPRRAWSPLPEGPTRPDELNEVVLDLPDPDASLFLEALGGDIGSEPVVPPAAGPGREAAGKLKAQLGLGLFWLGNKLNWKRLANLGAGLVRNAIEQAPRLSERVLGKQESVLRELLRQFKEGKVDDALRRALPLGNPADRGGTPAQDAHLPFHGLGYRLLDFLGLPRGPASVWLGGSSVYDELQREYHKAADDAIARGDFLRAAVVYGKLLQDWPRMGAMLARAGHHHDAALVYLQKLGDTVSAAREFEAAGEFDRALEIYARRGDHLASADLLRRIGETDRALEEYLKAAQKEADKGHYTTAARLLLTRAERPDLAERFLIAGWGKRPGGEAVGCLHELHAMYVQRQDRVKLLRLIEQAEEYFAAPGEDHAAGKYGSGLAVLAESDVFPDLKEELHDRALMLVARKLHQRGEVGDRSSGVVTMLFGGRPWEPSLVRDAEVALRGLSVPKAPRIAARRLAPHSGTVTAACAAWATGDLFLGFEDGTLVHVKPREGDAVVSRRAKPTTVVGLGCDARGSLVATVRQEERGDYSLSSYRHGRDGGQFAYHLGPRWGRQAPLMSNVAEAGGEQIVTLWDGESLEYRSGPTLAPALAAAGPEGVGLGGIVVLNQLNPLRSRTSTLVFGTDWFACLTTALAPQDLRSLPWVAASPRFPGLPWVAWRQVERTMLDVVAISSEGQLCWGTLKVFTRDSGVQVSCRAKEQARFVAGTALANGMVAGVHRDGVTWYRPGRDRMRLVAETQVQLKEAMACFDSAVTNELMIVCAQGEVVRVPVPE